MKSAPYDSRARCEWDRLGQRQDGQSRTEATTANKQVWRRGGTPIEVIGGDEAGHMYLIITMRVRSAGASAPYNPSISDKN